MAKSNLDEHDSAAVKREAYPHQDIRVGAVVAWRFNNEIRGYRITRLWIGEHTWLTPAASMFHPFVPAFNRAGVTQW